MALLDLFIMSSILEIFPIELVSLIIDAVAEVDNEDARDNYSRVLVPTVKACSLTCRLLLPICREHIFKRAKLDSYYRVRIQDPTSPSRAASFLELLAKTPEIADYVKELDVNFVLPDATHHLFKQCSSLATAIQKLNRLQKVALTGHDFDWQDFLTAFHAEAHHILTQPTITCLAFVGFKNFPLSAVGCCTNIRILDFRQVRLAETNERSNGVSLLKPVQLSQIRLERNSNKLLPQMLSQEDGDGNPFFSFEQFKCFGMHFHEMEDVGDAAIFLEHVPRVEDIDFKVPSWIHAREVVALLFPCLETLKRVKLSMSVDESSPDPLFGICQPLQEIADNKNVLEVLDISIFFAHPPNTDAGEWNDLANIMLAPGWLCLKQIDLTITVRSWIEIRFPTVVEALGNLPEARLARLAATGLFNFSFVVEDGCPSCDDPDWDYEADAPRF